MSPAQEEKLVRAACRALFLGTIVFGILAFKVRSFFGFGAIALFTGFMLIVQQAEKRTRARYSAAFDQAFASFQRAKPELKMERHYGFPSFTVTFQSEQDMQAAENTGHLNNFKLAIQELCAHRGWKANPFNVDRAVYATYVGRRYV
jgi:hypothetical protein